VGKIFETITYDPMKCKKELQALGRMLQAKPALSERDDILPFFKTRRQLAAFLGTFASDIGPATEIAYEYSFLGNYAADLIVGNRKSRHYLAVEFEDGKDTSIFKKVRNRSTTDWSARFDHGFSQLVDWFYTLDDYKKTDQFKKEFGHGHVSFTGLLVVGRNSGVTESDRLRLDWRTEKVLVDSHPISCITFDDLHQMLDARLAFYPAVSKVVQ
jgi:Domain of unknown function (DUF4263)